MQLTITTSDGELWASWEIKKGGPDPDEIEDLDGPLYEEEILYIDELKKCHDPLSSVKDEILRMAKYRD